MADIGIGGLADSKEHYRQLDEEAFSQALQRAVAQGITAYAVAGLSGVYAVTSSRELGWVYEVKLTNGGQPWACTCEARVRFCKHAAAARHVFDLMKEQEDIEINEQTTERIAELKGIHNDG